MTIVSELFKPLDLGAIRLSHRVIHTPTTRLRAEADDSPSAMMVEYYRQRASAGGLLITESAHPVWNRVAATWALLASTPAPMWTPGEK